MPSDVLRIDIPAPLHRALKEQAERNYITTTALTRLILAGYLADANNKTLEDYLIEKSPRDPRQPELPLK